MAVTKARDLRQRLQTSCRRGLHLDADLLVRCVLILVDDADAVFAAPHRLALGEQGTLQVRPLVHRVLGERKKQNGCQAVMLARWE